MLIEVRISVHIAAGSFSVCFWLCYLWIDSSTVLGKARMILVLKIELCN